jgi:hypothetical protein
MKAGEPIATCERRCPPTVLVKSIFSGGTRIEDGILVLEASVECFEAVSRSSPLDLGLTYTDGMCDSEWLLAGPLVAKYRDHPELRFLSSRVSLSSAPRAPLPGTVKF